MRDEPVEPVEPPPTVWELPDPTDTDTNGIAGIGADLEPGTLLAAYRRGLFPMRVSGGALGWWSPETRGVLPLERLHVSRSLRRSMRHFEVRVDTCFESVVRACADPDRPHGWIDESFVEAYTRLFELGWAHSFEAWRDGRCVGGCYGVAIERFFAGESMFHHETDAGKVALVAGARWLHGHGFVLFDVQWATEHLASLGVVAIDREQYLAALAEAVRPAPGGGR